MALEHQTKAVADLCGMDANGRWCMKVPNMVFDGTKGWKTKLPDSHPMLELSVRNDASDYGHFKYPDPKLKPTKASAVCDSGANKRSYDLLLGDEA